MEGLPVDLVIVEPDSTSLNADSSMIGYDPDLDAPYKEYEFTLPEKTTVKELADYSLIVTGAMMPALYHAEYQCESARLNLVSGIIPKDNPGKEHFEDILNKEYSVEKGQLIIFHYSDWMEQLESLRAEAASEEESLMNEMLAQEIQFMEEEAARRAEEESEQKGIMESLETEQESRVCYLKEGEIVYLDGSPWMELDEVSWERPLLTVKFTGYGPKTIMPHYVDLVLENDMVIEQSSAEIDGSDMSRVFNWAEYTYIVPLEEWDMESAQLYVREIFGEESFEE